MVDGDNDHITVFGKVGTVKHRLRTGTGSKAATVQPYPAVVFARYIPERFDDFAWENDRIAHRIYGPGLDSPAAGGTRMISSGVDVWCKRVRYPIVDRWYVKGHYHSDSGEGLDMYDVGTNRGCGGIGVWDGQKLLTSQNWKTWKVLANGPIRAVFELTYEPWDASNGVKVSETKRFTVDAGHNLDAIDSTFAFTPAPGSDGELTIASGLTLPTGLAVDGAGDLFVAESGSNSRVDEYPWNSNTAGCGFAAALGRRYFA